MYYDDFGNYQASFDTSAQNVTQSFDPDYFDPVEYYGFYGFGFSVLPSLATTEVIFAEPVIQESFGQDEGYVYGNDLIIYYGNDAPIAPPTPQVNEVTNTYSDLTYTATPAIISYDQNVSIPAENSDLTYTATPAIISYDQNVYAPTETAVSAAVQEIATEALSSVFDIISDIELPSGTTSAPEKPASGSSSSTKDNLSFIINNLEGGSKLVTDINGAPVKYGVNQAYYPGSVANLTESQAKAWYEKHYSLDGFVSPSASDAFKLVAQDALIQHGADNHTRSMINRADGDPDKLLEIREQYIKELAKDNPAKYNPIMKGLMNRYAKLANQVDLIESA
jgi:hypothetical protein